MKYKSVGELRLPCSHLIVYSWNLRGFNDPQKIKDVAHFLKFNNITITDIFEIILNNPNVRNIVRQLGNGWCWVMNYDYNRKGIIQLEWKNAVIEMTFKQIQEQLIQCSIIDKDSNKVVDSTLIYGLNIIAEKKDLWNGLIHISQWVNAPWLIMGDFNTPFDIDHWKNGANVSLNDGVWYQCCDNMNLCGLKNTGRFYSQRKCEKVEDTHIIIDHEVVNAK